MERAGPGRIGHNHEYNRLPSQEKTTEIPLPVRNKMKYSSESADPLRDRGRTKVPNPRTARVAGQLFEKKKPENFMN